MKCRILFTESSLKLSIEIKQILKSCQQVTQALQKYLLKLSCERFKHQNLAKPQIGELLTSF